MDIELNKAEKMIHIKQNGKIVGIAYYKPRRFDYQKEIGIVIKKEYQGKGLGKKAILRLEKLAKKNKVQKLVCLTFINNDRMNNLMTALKWDKFKIAESKYNLYTKLLCPKSLNPELIYNRL